MKIRFVQILVAVLSLLLMPLAVFSDDISRKDKILHFDQPQVPLESLDFEHDDELKPVPNDFRIVEVSYLSNDIGERWAIITFENSSSGKRFLKNKAVVATFADGVQVNSFNLDETIEGNERLTKTVFFGNHRFPIVSVKVK